MRELKNVKYAHSSNMDEDDKDALLIPEEYYGLVAIETWEVYGELRLKGVVVSGGIIKYIKGFGDFKDGKV